jgi:hypothetical protein
LLVLGDEGEQKLHDLFKNIGVYSFGVVRILFTSLSSGGKVAKGVGYDVVDSVILSYKLVNIPRQDEA